MAAPGEKHVRFEPCNQDGKRLVAQYLICNGVAILDRINTRCIDTASDLIKRREHNTMQDRSGASAKKTTVSSLHPGLL